MNNASSGKKQQAKRKSTKSARSSRARQQQIRSISQVFIMNASAQAQSISMVSKIANVSTIVNAKFPSALVDFSPWLLDEKTQKQFDPGSIDISFSFPGWQPQLSCGCMLLQIYFLGKLQSADRSLNRIKLTGHDYRGQHWRFSTHADWQFTGIILPSAEGQQQIKTVIGQLHTLFGRPAKLPQ